jgi:FkbM family methyltransferase
MLWRLTMAEILVQNLIRTAPIAEVKALKALRWLCYAVPLRHRLFPLLEPFVPEHGLVAVPFAGRTMLYPAAWVGEYTASHLFTPQEVFPEQALFQHALGQAGPGTVVDVGANVGAYLLLIRQVSDAPIVAYEPSPTAYQVAKRSIAINGLTRIELRPAACGHTASRTYLQESANSYIGEGDGYQPCDVRDADALLRHVRQQFTPIEVDQVTLDDDLVDRERIALVKIDCEGYEYRVLVGARRLLRERRPVLFIELHPAMIGSVGDTPERLCALLVEHSYELACWNFQRGRPLSRVKRVMARYAQPRGHRYETVESMLADLPRSMPQQTYIVATPAP